MRGRKANFSYFKDHQNDLKAFGRDMRRMALPVMTEQAAAVVMNMISTMISSRLGPAAISAIGSVGKITMLVISVFSSLSAGGTVVVAQYLGKKRRDKAESAVSCGLVSTAVISSLSVILLYIFREPIVRGLFRGAEEEVLQLSVIYLGTVSFYYLPFSITTMGLALLRGAGDMRSPMLVSLIMNAVSLAVSYPLIYGFAPVSAGRGFGIRGAALSLIVAQSVGMILVLFILFSPKGRLSVRPRELLKPSFKMLRNILYFGLPSGAESVMFNGGKLITQTFIMSLGTAAVAADTIAQTLTGFVGIGGNSFNLVATTMVGQAVGAEEYEKARRWNFFITISSSVLFFLILIVFIPFSRLMILPFTRDPETVKIAARIFRSYLIVIPFLHPPSFTLPAGLRGAGDVRFTMIVSILSMWLLRVGMSYVLAVVLNLGVIGIWIGMYIDWIGRAACFIPRAYGRKWLHQKTLS